MTPPTWPWRSSPRTLTPRGNGGRLRPFQTVTGEEVTVVERPFVILKRRLAIRRGSGFVRLLFIAALAALILRYAYDLSRPS